MRLPKYTFLLFFFSQFLIAQTNLVPNPGFEAYSTCPSGPGQWQVMNSWNNVNMNTGAGAWGTPDYFTSCGTGQTAPPATFAGTCSPHTGNAMTALVVYNVPYPNYREYMAVPLTCSMLPNYTYTVSFWVTNGTGIKSPWSIKNIGIAFSQGPLSQTGWGLVSATPQLEVTTNVASNSWVQYSFTIIPSAAWNYMTVGVFRADNLNNPTLAWPNPGGAPSVYANYFFDDFSVTGAPTATSVVLTPIITQPTVCNGPAVVSISVTGLSNPTLTWTPGNLTGVSHTLNPGTYTVSTSYLSNCVLTPASTVFVINGTPAPNLSVSASSASMCAGGTVSLTGLATSSNAGPLTYSWSTTSTASSIAIAGSTQGNTLITLQVTDGIGCTSSDSILVSTYSLPVISVPVTTLCSPGSATLIASGAQSYVWANPLQPGNSIVVSPNSTTQYTVTGYSSAGCSGSLAINQVVILTPTLTVVSNTNNVCPGSVVSLSSFGAASYSWSTLQAGASATLVVPSNTFVTVTGNNGPCASTGSINLFTLPIPAIAFQSYSINCASLGAASATASGGTGPYSYYWSPTGQTTAFASNFYPGNYTLTVNDAGTGCSNSYTTYFAPLVPLTGTVTATDSLMCPGTATASASVALSNGSGSSNYNWTGPGYSSTLTSVSNLGTGLYTVTVGDQLTFCTVTHTFFVSQPPVFNLIISPSTYSVCMGDSIYVQAQNSGGTPGYNYLWTGGNAGPGNVYKETSAGIYTYNVNSYDSRMCPSSKSITLQFVANPTITVTTPSVCPLQTISIAAGGALTYTWQGGQTGASQVFSAPVTTVINVTGSTAGCTGTAQLLFFVYPPPSPVINYSPSICAGDTLKLLVTGAQSYQWLGPIGFTSIATSNTIYPATVSNSGNYLVKAFSAEGCTATAIASVAVHPIPLLTCAGSTVCAGSTMSLSSNFIVGGTYTWTGSSFSSTVQNPQLPNATVNMSGSYNLLVKSPYGCTAVATATASVVPQPTILVTGPSAVCEQSSISFTAAGGNQYTWYGPGNYYATQSVVSLSNVALSSSGLYSLTAQSGPCIQQLTYSLTVNQKPIINITSNAPLCEGKKLSLSCNSAQSYTWIMPGGGINNQQILIVDTVKTNSQGVYTISLTDVNGCVSSSMTPVTVNPAPALFVQNYSVCYGSAVTLSVVSSGSITWSIPAVISPSISAGFAAGSASLLLSSVTWSPGGTFTVNSTGSNGCVTSRTLDLTVLLLPWPSIKTDSLKIACSGSTVGISAEGGEAYTWHGPNNFFYEGQQFAVNGNDPKAAGIYTLFVTNKYLCNLTATVQVKLVKAPVVKLVTENDCVPFCNKFNVQSSPSYSAVFYFQNGQMLKGPDYCISEPGKNVFSVFVKDSFGCGTYVSNTITSVGRPVADFTNSPVRIVAGSDPVHFYNLSTGGKKLSPYWYIGDDHAGKSEDNNPVYYFEKAGTYPVVLVVNDEHGCSDTIIKLCVVENEFSLYVPDAFSPNEDGVNDHFLPKGLGIKTYNIRIYNRWGEMIFSGNDIYKSWDGYYKGQICPPDSYVWLIEASDYSGKKFEYKGFVVLLK